MRTTGHLFAGIDGYGLGLGATGHYTTAWTVELNDYSRAILETREPGADHMTDILEVTNPPRVDVLTGGFPCQDLSLAGKGAGIRGRRSGLWGQYARIIGEVDPELVLIENVPALLHRGFEVVVRDLVDLGYRVEWDCLPAAAFGAPHLRDRVWVAAHRLDAPSMFGQPAALFPTDPGVAADLVGGDEDDDGATTWARWPRAGYIDADPALVMPLQPLAYVPDVKRGQRLAGASIETLWPTVVASDALGSRRSTARTEAWTSNPGTTLLDAVSDAEGILWATPNARDGGGGSSDARKRRADGRQINLRDHVREVAGLADPVALKAATAKAGGSATALNPPWVEWLMGFPLGWTDPAVANADLVEHPWRHGEPPGVPRVAAKVPDRRARLTALGNALVPPAAAWLGHRYHHANPQEAAA